MIAKLFAALAFLALDFYIYQYLATADRIPERRSFAEFPLSLSPESDPAADLWRCPGAEEMDARALRFLGASDYWICSYSPERDGATPVGVYLGYHESQVRREGGGVDGSSIHPPEHCLPGAGWDIIDSRIVPIDFPGLPAGHGLRDGGPSAKRFVIAKGDERQLVYFWYQGQGRVVSDNVDVILHRFFDRAVKGRSDGALIRFTVPLRGRGAPGGGVGAKDPVRSAEARFREVASLVVPLLPEYIPD